MTVRKNMRRQSRSKLCACHFAIALPVSGCGDKLCDNSVVSENASENKIYIATVFDRNCGATTSIVRVVALRKEGEVFDPESSENWALTVHGQPKIELTWMGADQLKIRYIGYVESKSSLEEWHGLKISITPQ